MCRIDRLRPQPMPTGLTGCRLCVPVTGRVCLERGPNDEFPRHHGQLALHSMLSPRQWSSNAIWLPVERF